MGHGAGIDPAADRMLDAARRGSNRAWAAMLEQLDPGCRALAHLVLGGHAVDPTLLSAYVRAYRARRKGSDDAVVFLTHHVWIACGHAVRRRERRQAPAPGRRAVRDDRVPRLGDDPLARAVADLRPEERAVWALVTRAGVAPVATAEALGVDPVVVSTVEYRVVARLDEATAASEVDEQADLADPVGVEADDTIERDAASQAADADDGEPVVAHTDAAEPDGSGPDDGLAPGDGAPDAPRSGDEVQGEATAAVPSTTAADDATDDAGSLDPPPASPAFWRELGRRLRAEREKLPAAPPPPLSDPAAPPPYDPAKAPPVAMQKRAPARIRRLRPDLVEGLAGEVERQRTPRNWPSVLGRIAVVLVAMGLLGAALGALYLSASNAKSPVRGESVADISGRSMEVLADAGTWSATVERSTVAAGGGQQSATLQLLASADGSYRVEDASIGRVTTYEANFAVFRDTVVGFPPREEVGVAPGPPDPAALRAELPLDDLALAARTLSDQEDREPERTKFNGRSVWELEATLSGERRLTYLVDTASLVPVRITVVRGGVTERELRFSEVRLDAAPSFTQEIAPGGPAPVDRGFVPVPIGEVERRIDIRPLTPDYLPAGFVPAGTAVNEADRIASLRYARGPQQVVITVRPSPVEPGRDWDDPFDRGDATVAATPVRLGEGAFADATASQVSGGLALPSIWAADGDLAFTIAGDVSGDDLVEMARSLR